MAAKQQHRSAPVRYSQWFVLVTAVFIICLIAATGQRLKPREHLKLSQEEVATRCRTLAELRAARADKDKREALLRDLGAQNVSPELLARLLKTPRRRHLRPAGPLAFSAPLVSRDERAKAFLNRNQDFPGRFKGKAREILDCCG
jgi:type I restriction enzyme R subunit